MRSNGTARAVISSNHQVKLPIPSLMFVRCRITWVAGLTSLTAWAPALRKAARLSHCGPATPSEGFTSQVCPHGHSMPELISSVSYTHLRAHETRHDLVC